MVRALNKTLNDVFPPECFLLELSWIKYPIFSLSITCTGEFWPGKALCFSGFSFPNEPGLCASEWDLPLFIAVDMCLKRAQLSYPELELTKLFGSVSALLGQPRGSALGS